MRSSNHRDEISQSTIFSFVWNIFQTNENISKDKLLEHIQREETKSVEMFEKFAKMSADILLRTSFSYECDIQEEGSFTLFLTVSMSCN